MTAGPGDIPEQVADDLTRPVGEVPPERVEQARQWVEHQTAEQRRIVVAPPRVGRPDGEYEPRPVGEQLTDGNGMLDVWAFWSDTDDRLVVQIDTSQPVRVFLNDGTLYDGDPEEEDLLSGEMASVLLDITERASTANSGWADYENHNLPMASPAGWRQLREQAVAVLHRLAARYR